MIPMSEMDGVYETCPLCESEQNIDQPTYGTHAFTICYGCGSEIDYPIGYKGASWGVSCDGKHKRFKMPEIRKKDGN